MYKNRSMSMKILTRSAILLAIVFAAQALHLPQMITGPLVNAVLIYATLTLGLGSGLSLSVLVVLGSFLLGFMKVPLPPLIPLIMLANVAFAACFRLLHGYGPFWRLAAAMAIGAGAKFAVFYLAIHYVFQWLGIAVPAPVYVVFGVTQLFTALIGGLAALLVDAILKGRGRLPRL